MMKNRTTSKLLSIILAASMFGAMAAPRLVLAAEETVEVGTTSNFAILAGETVINTGSTEFMEMSVCMQAQLSPEHQMSLYMAKCTCPILWR